MRAKSRSPDRPEILIDIGQVHEVGYWTGKWGCTVEQLRDAVNAVGPMMKDVRSKLECERGLRRFE